MKNKTLCVVKVILALCGIRSPKSFTIKLPSNASTGYHWERRECCFPTIIRDSNRYVQHNGPPGTGGVDIWTFTALKRGNEIVKLVYVSDSDHNDIQDEREFHFTVI